MPGPRLLIYLCVPNQLLSVHVRSDGNGRREQRSETRRGIGCDEVLRAANRWLVRML